MFLILCIFLIIFVLSCLILCTFVFLIMSFFYWAYAWLFLFCANQDPQNHWRISPKNMSNFLPCGSIGCVWTNRAFWRSIHQSWRKLEEQGTKVEGGFDRSRQYIRMAYKRGVTSINSFYLLFMSSFHL